jgi:hypothetical protein
MVGKPTLGHSVNKGKRKAPALPGVGPTRSQRPGGGPRISHPYRASRAAKSRPSVLASSSTKASWSGRRGSRRPSKPSAGPSGRSGHYPLTPRIRRTPRAHRPRRARRRSSTSRRRGSLALSRAGSAGPLREVGPRRPPRHVWGVLPGGHPRCRGWAKPASRAASRAARGRVRCSAISPAARGVANPSWKPPPKSRRVFGLGGGAQKTGRGTRCS